MIQWRKNIGTPPHNSMRYKLFRMKKWWQEEWKEEGRLALFFFDGGEGKASHIINKG